MNKESKNIESWSNDILDRTRVQVRNEQLSGNAQNQAWWEALPMTYENWESEQRDPVTAEDFERVDRHYFGTNPYILQNLTFSEFAGKEVLEVGCGAGSAACGFAKAGARVLAVDITQKAVDLTRAHAEISQVTDWVEVLQADAENLAGIEEDRFDALYSWGVMHHSSNPEACFEQACKRLKSGGKGWIMVYHQNSFRYWVKGWLHLIAKGKIFQGETLRTVQRFYTDGFYHKHYTSETLRAAMVNAGFEVEGIDVTHMSSRMIPGLPESLRQWLKSRIGWLIVARVRKR